MAERPNNARVNSHRRKVGAATTTFLALSPLQLSKSALTLPGNQPALREQLAERPRYIYSAAERAPPQSSYQPRQYHWWLGLDFAVQCFPSAIKTGHSACSLERERPHRYSRKNHTAL